MSHSLMSGGVLLHTLLWFQRAVPEPTEKIMQTQLGVHLEEVGEMLETIYSTDRVTALRIVEAEQALKALATHLKTSNPLVHVPKEKQKDFLDAICDQLVTATGVAHGHNFDVLGALDEVNRSNWSKFVGGEPIFDANMKIQKGPDYFKADLTKFIPA